LTETVVHDHNGLLFEPNNIEALAEALEILILDEKKRKVLGENGYHRTIEHFSLEKHTEKFETIFEKL
jgi:glycosyltransferase involved in cell wall biosynthesis